MTRIYFRSRRVINVVETCAEIHEQMYCPTRGHMLWLNLTNGRRIVVYLPAVDYFEDRS